ncbi:hypothetical protein LJB71_07295 [Thermomonas sp. S9]|uniref:hypothetical protein n=1 Tax=Thermomonas sp. S9 TaxID=2885203 RepID=UPI00216AE77E|nr:hypothetical protein [Thermomonas sp. S9]MCR6496042.1 hypothetical protein [Thermomonas sp. S9]
MTVRDRVKSVTPEFIRRILRCILNYVCRLGRWVIILWQIRGAKIADEGVLWVSAFVAPVTSLSNLGGWQDPVLLWDATLNVQGFGVFRVRARTDDLWHVLPWRERRLFRVIRKFLGEGDVFVDAGANIGVFSVLASLIVGGWKSFCDRDDAGHCPHSEESSRHEWLPQCFCAGICTVRCRW